MKFFLSAICLVFLCVLTKAQDQLQISGYVVDGNGQPLSQVHITLHESTQDSTIVAMAATDSTGHFVLRSQGELRPLRFSCVGYAPKLILANGGNLETVVMVEASSELGEVVVEGKSKIFRPDGITFIPSARKAANAVNGMALLGSLKAPRVYVDPLSYDVSVRGGGEVVLLVNDRPATSGEIQAIDPELIRRVDYYDKPTPRFPLASVVMNLTVDLPAKGGSASVNLVEGVSNTYGEHYLIGKVYHGRHSFTLDWQPQFRYSNGQMRERTDYFYFPTGTIVRKEQPIPARQAYWHNIGTARYNYAGRKYMLDLSAWGQVDDDKNNDFEGRVVTTSDAGTETTLNREHNSGHNKNYGLCAYLEVKSPLGPVYLNADYSRRQASYRRAYGESTADELFATENHTSEKVHHAGLQGSYTLPFPLGEVWAGMFSVSGSWRKQWITNDYSANGQAALPVHLRDNSGDTKMLLMLMGDELMVALGAVHFWQAYQIEGVEKKWSQWLPIGAISYQPLENWTIDFDAMLKYSQPPLGQITATEILLDPFQIQRGNPSLSKTRLTQFTLNSIWDFATKYELFLQGKYRHIKNPIMDATRLEQLPGGGYVAVRMPDNFGAFKQYTISCSLDGTDLWDFLSFSLNGGLSYYDSHGGDDYHHQEVVPFYQGELSMKWRKWDLLSEAWYGQNDALMGEMLKSKSWHTRFMLSRRHKRMQLSMGVLNPFIKFRDVKYENLSSVALYTRYAYNRMYENLVFAKFTYLFTWGDEQKKRSKPKLKATEFETTIVKGER